MSLDSLRAAATSMAFVVVTSLVLVSASERLYWYLDGVSLAAFVEVAAFYIIPTVATLWVFGSGPSAHLHQVVLVGAVYGFVVEGVLTAVVYEDGPLPLLAFMFVGWHGLLAVGWFWFGIRRLLVAGRTRLLAIGSAAVGVYWGVWSTTWMLPEATSGFDTAFEVMTRGQFAAYAMTVGAVVVAAHLLLDRVWPESFVLGRRARAVVVLVVAGYGAIAVVPLVWWAPFKFAVLIGGTLWLLNRSRRVDPGAETVIASLAGRVALRSAVAVMAMPFMAALVYASLWEVGMSENGVRLLHEAMYWSQIVVGAIAYSWAAARSIRSATAAPAPP